MGDNICAVAFSAGWAIIDDIGIPRIIVDNRAGLPNCAHSWGIAEAICGVEPKLPACIGVGHNHIGLGIGIV